MQIAAGFYDAAHTYLFPFSKDDASLCGLRGAGKFKIAFKVKITSFALEFAIRHTDIVPIYLNQQEDTPMRADVLHRRICGLIAEAIASGKAKDGADVAKRIGVAPGTLRNKKCDGELADLKFHQVCKIADAAGYDVEFVKR